MKSIKQSLPDIDVVDSQLKSILEGDLPKFIKATQDTRARVKSSLLFALTSIAFLVALSVFLYLSGVNYETWPSKFIIMLALLWATVLLISGRSWFMNTQLLAREINMALVPVFGALFDRQFLYTHNRGDTSTIKSLLSDSSLMTDKNITIGADDSYQSFGEQPVDFHELTVTSKQSRGPKGESRDVLVFKGLFMVATLPKSHNAETYITTDNDRSGFANRSFWSDLLEHGKVKETVLEWNDFEEDLHVATDNPSIAREILNPEFMQDLHTWWLEHKLDIRISFKQDKLYLLIPETTISISTTTSSERLSAIKHYATSLAKPMWRGFLLVEDASK
ncbi:DUF3137 domain-containing protein [Candidatus Kaiserbacteria bacterium]|nr:DUF3137 domain-containing protein [Candidatus Kaiserbacteria bacterium]